MSQFTNIEIGHPVKVADIAGGQRGPCHQGRRRYHAVQRLDAVGRAELPGQLGDARVDVNHRERGQQRVNPGYLQGRQVGIAVQFMLRHG